LGTRVTRAAVALGGQVGADVRELISLEDVMEELELGPNGGLVFCMEYLVDHPEWLEDLVDGLGEDCYVLLDCPGQIELFSHVPVMRTLVGELHRLDFRVAGVYLLDAQFMVEPAKYLSGVLSCLSCMAALELPHINVLTKLDLIAQRSAVERFLDPPIEDLVAELAASEADERRAALTGALGQLIGDYGMVNFLGLDPTEEASVDVVLMAVDHAIQYHDDVEPRDPGDVEEEDEDDAVDGPPGNGGAALGIFGGQQLGL